MRISDWSSDVCLPIFQELHLPLDLGYGKALLDRAGHQTLLLDGGLMDKGNDELATLVAQFAPDMTIVTTAPTYLFWRCAQPELRVPRDFLRHLGSGGGTTVAYQSATPEPSRNTVSSRASSRSSILTNQFMRCGTPTRCGCSGSTRTRQFSFSSASKVSRVHTRRSYCTSECIPQPAHTGQSLRRSEERRVGKEGVRTGKN